MEKHQLTHLRWLILSLLLATGVGSAWGQTTDTYTFTSKSWAATLNGNAANWTSGKDGNQMTSGQGIQVTTGVSGANATSPISFTNISKIVVTYCTNASKGVGSVAIKVGSNTAQSQNVSAPSSNGTALKTLEYNYPTPQTGNVKITVTCTTNSIYINSIAVTYNSTPKTETEVTFPQESYDTSIPGSFSAPTATVKNKNTDATISGATVSYTSSNTAVATVNNTTGSVTLVGVGTTSITATYAGNSTYEGSTGSYNLTVTDGRSETNVSFPQDTYIAILGESFASPTATLSPSGIGSLTYNSSNTDVATVNSSTGAVTINAVGTTNITASYAGNATYKPSSATYALTVSNSSSSNSFTWDLSTNSYNSTSANQVVWSSDYATMTSDKNTSSTNANNYLGGDANNRTSSRFYSGFTLTIAPASGYKITSIEFVATTTNYANILKNSTWNNASASVNGTTVTVTPTDGTSNVVATIGGTCGFTGVTVYYEQTSSTAPNAPTLTASRTFWPKTTEAASMVVTIAPTTAGSYVRYTTDGTEPSTSNGTLVISSQNVTITGTTTVKAIAYVGAATSTIATATYTLGQTVNSVAAFKALATGTEARLYLSPANDARVLHASGSEIYVRDNTGAICLFLNSSLQNPVPQHDYHVAGWIIGKYQPYNGLPEMVATSNTTTDYLAFAAPVTEAATEPVAISANDFDNYKADWVTITDLRAEGDGDNINVSDDDANTLKVYNKYNLNNDNYYQDPYDGALVDLTGLAVPYNSTKEIVPIYYNNARPIIYVIDENKDFKSPSVDIQNATVRLVRTLSNTNWNTFVIPMYMENFEGTIRRYDRAEGTTMMFEDEGGGIQAGMPYLVKPINRIENPVYSNVTLCAQDARNIEADGYHFVGIYSPENIYEESKVNRFLKSDGYLYYPTDEDAGRLKGLRAYFVVPDGTGNVKVNPDGTATIIDEVQSTMYEEQGAIYDVSGRVVGNDLHSLPRGIYIVNGKKIVVR